MKALKISFKLSGFSHTACIFITMAFSSRKYLHVDASIHHGFDDDEQDPSTLYDISGPLLGASNIPKVPSRRATNLKSWLRYNIATISLTLAIILLVIETICIVKIQRRANARFLGPSMLVPLANMFRFH